MSNLIILFFHYSTKLENAISLIAKIQGKTNDFLENRKKKQNMKKNTVKCKPAI